MDRIFNQAAGSAPARDSHAVITQDLRTPTMLRMNSRMTWQCLVGLAGFEPAASCSQSKRASQAALQPADK